MPTAIALIRGINVGGKHSLPMASLHSLCEKLGWQNVATHIQSGNVVFRCADRSLARAAERLEDAIEAQCTFRPSVVVRSLADLRAAAAANPFAPKRGQPELDPAKLLVMFLAGEPPAAAKRAVAALKPDPESVVLVGREVYLHYPVGVGASKFPFSKVEKAVATPGTSRNWNTVMKMLAMAEAVEAAS